MFAFAVLLLTQTAPQCAAMDATLPASFAGWKTAGSALSLGHAAELPTQGGALSASFTIAAAGTYAVALDQPGWVDVLPAGASVPIKSVATGHGLDCSTIRKIVRFKLEPGSYTLVIRNLKQPRAKVMLAGE